MAGFGLATSRPLVQHLNYWTTEDRLTDYSLRMRTAERKSPFYVERGMAAGQYIKVWWDFRFNWQVSHLISDIVSPTTSLTFILWVSSGCRWCNQGCKKWNVLLVKRQVGLHITAMPLQVYFSALFCCCGCCPFKMVKKCRMQVLIIRMSKFFENKQVNSRTIIA